MSKYHITVSRVGYSYATVEVEASDIEEAEQLAIEESYDCDFNEKSSEYFTNIASGPIGD